MPLQAPAPRFLAVMLLAMATMLVTIGLALKLPFIAAPRLVPGYGALAVAEATGPVAVTAVSAAGLAPVAVPPGLRLEEPDLLGSRRAMARLYQQQGVLHDRLRASSPRFHLIDGRVLPVTVRPRGLGDLPALFWWQLASGWICVAVGAATWAFRPRLVPARHYLLMAWGAALAAWSAAVYGTRPLTLPVEWFPALSALNGIGSLLFGAELLALMLCYPRPLVSGWLSVLPVTVALALGALSVGGVIDSTTVIYAVLLLCLLAASAAQAGQWYATRHRPDERAALRWQAFVIHAGTGLLILLNLAPVLLHLPPLSAQGWVFGAIALIYAGLALGILRYRLFALERWWFRAWLWLLGGLLVVLIDLLLISLLALPLESSLLLSLLLAGWVYFPLRQWLWSRLRPTPSAQLQEVLPALIEQTLASHSTGELEAKWRALLERLFEPLAITPADGPAFGLGADGCSLHVPGLDDSTSWRLEHAGRGSRLFRQEDVELARLSHRTLATTARALRAREDGALQERSRIREDLHDDLGARLLTILHSKDADEKSNQARLAFADLRDILSTLEQQPSRLCQALNDWEGESRERLAPAGMAVDWQVRLARNPLLSARQAAELRRLLRECLNNTLRHAHADRVHVAIACEASCLRLTITDNGTEATASLHQAGRGRRGMLSRAERIGAVVDWQATAQGGLRVSVTLPLTGEMDD